MTRSFGRTAPFVQAEDLQRGFNLLHESGADYAFSVTSYPFPIQRAVRITTDQRVEMFNPEHFNTRSQDLEEAFHDAGQFYWGRAAAWLAGKPLFSHDAVEHSNYFHRRASDQYVRASQSGAASRNER